MDKKEYLLKILVQLEPIRDLALGLRILVEQGNLGDDVLGILIDAVQGAVNTASTEVAKKRLKKGLDALEKIRQMETESRTQDERDLTELDRMIDSFNF